VEALHPFAGLNDARVAFPTRTGITGPTAQAVADVGLDTVAGRRILTIVSYHFA